MAPGLLSPPVMLRTSFSTLCLMVGCANGLPAPEPYDNSGKNDEWATPADAGPPAMTTDAGAEEPPEEEPPPAEEPVQHILFEFPALEIPDNDAEVGASSTIELQEDFKVVHIEVQATITHPNYRQLAIVLTHGENYVIAYQGEDYGPAPADGVVTLWYEVEADIGSAGEWTLHVVDREAGLVGTFDEWALTLSPEAPAAE